LDEGYVDTLQVVKGEEAGRTGTFTTEHPGQRVDYVFAYGIDRARIRDAWVETGGEAREASDHFPVGVESE
jgi:endonuclease/exonuclease/phosphatase family metal-dependent hydrolase